MGILAVNGRTRNCAEFGSKTGNLWLHERPESHHDRQETRFGATLLRSNLLFVGIALLAVLNAGSAYAQSSVPRESAWVIDGPVSAILPTPTTTYIGGTFSYVGPYTDDGVPIDAATGLLNAVFPSVGRMWACVPDGVGGWYIGGYFTKVRTFARNGIAHVLADGSVDALWDPNVGGNDPGVSALAISGGLVYVGGRFTSIGGQLRNNIAALDATTGLATDWDPDAGGTSPSVDALAVANGVVYAGGYFTSIGGQTRNYIAALDATTGSATAWDPNAGGGIAPSIHALVVQSGTVYAGGTFTSIGGQARKYVGALDTVTGLATAWNPSASGSVWTLASSGGVIYAGGAFATIGGQARNHVAALDMNTGLATAWNPNADDSVNTLALSNGVVYAGGAFTRIGGQTRKFIAALDADTGLATDWNPNANRSISILAVSGGIVYAGGEFTSIGGQTRNYVAALDTVTNSPTAWNPNVVGYPSDIYAIAKSDEIVYVGGFFTRIGGQPYVCVAALDSTTGAATNWNAHANIDIKSLAVSGATVYAGGVFTRIGGQTRHNIAALDAATGLATDWDPNVGGTNLSVNAMAVSDQAVYVGGSFTSVGGQTRHNIAALDRATGLATAWDPNASGGSHPKVNALVVSGNVVYVGGDFTSIGGQTRNGLAALDAATGLATNWNPNVGGALPVVYAMAVSGGVVYVGGFFTSVGGQTRNYLAAIDTVTGLPTSWDPHPDYYIQAVAVLDGVVYVGGAFSSIGDQPYSFFAKFDTAPSVSSVTRAGPGLTNAPSVQYTVTFSGAVSGVAASSFALTTTGSISGTSIASVTGSGDTYLVTVNTGSGDGTIRLDIPDDDSIVGATSLLPLGGPGSGNGKFVTGEVYTVDKGRPTVSMSSAAPQFTNASPIPVVVTFSEPVSGFSSSGVIAGNASVSQFSGSGANYSFNLIPSGQGEVTADIHAGVAQDLATNTNMVAQQFSRGYDTEAPTVSIGPPSSSIASTGPVTYTVTFGAADAITLVSGDVKLNTTGTASASVSVSGTGNLSRTVTLSGITGNGTLGISIPANTASDAAGNPAPGAGPSTTLLVDNVPPAVSVSSPASDPTSSSPIPVTITFSKVVYGFTASNIVVSNATVANFVGSGASYTFDLVPVAFGALNANVPGGVATDSAGNINTPSGILTRTYAPPPNPADIDIDGSVSAVDVQLVINKALGLAISGNADVDGNGEVDAVDVQRVINAALGIG